jgi:single-strand DNA-binding protein
MPNVNLVILIGHLGHDPSLENVKGTDKVTFSLATTEKWKNKEGILQENTCWHNIVCWDKVGNVAYKYLKKGNPVYIEGRIDNRSYEDKEGKKKYWSEVVVRRLQLMGRSEKKDDDDDPEFD